MVRTALSGKGRWRLYVMTSALLLVGTLEGWKIVRMLLSPQDYAPSDYSVPIIVISLHVILFLKVKQRCDYLALIRKLSKERPSQISG